MIVYTSVACSLRLYDLWGRDWLCVRCVPCTPSTVGLRPLDATEKQMNNNIIGEWEAASFGETVLCGVLFESMLLPCVLSDQLALYPGKEKGKQYDTP